MSFIMQQQVRCPGLSCCSYPCGADPARPHNANRRPTRARISTACWTPTASTCSAALPRPADVCAPVAYRTSQYE
jgi:hypothetical protein